MDSETIVMLACLILTSFVMAAAFASVRQPGL